MSYTPLSHVTTGDLATAALQNTLLDNVVAVRAGELAITSQAVGDFLYASSTTQMGRLAAAAGWPFYTGSAWAIKPQTKSAISVSTNVLTVDLASGANPDIFTFTLDANITTMTISNIPASAKIAAFVLVMAANGTGYTWAWLTSTVKWPNGTAPTMTTTSGKSDIFSFISYDGGTTWIGSLIGQVYTI